ncbi:MAG: hypothetical protein QF652_02305 [Dehalococcoidia bacterium]|jgi:hypothetical protein|nr:hypothetical protein [Dehalococcoidia bacterium]
MRGSLVTVVLVMTALAVGCSGISQVFEPLPPANTLNFQATLNTGDTVGGTRTIRLSWTPPDESVDLIVLEESRDGPNGPWTEFKTLVPTRGFHLESAIYRPGRVFYFRAIIVRGNEESAPTEPVRVWVPYEPQRPTNTPLPAYTPTPTPTPDPDAPTPTAIPTSTPTPTPDPD